MIANKEADLAICKLSITFLRAGRVLFTHPYIELHQGLLINRLLLAKQLRGRVKEEALRSLTGKVGVIANSSYVGYAKRNFGDMEMVEFPSWKRVVQAVTSGEIIAGYRDEAEIKKIIRDEPNSAVKLLTATLLDAKDPKGIAVSADSTHLRELLEFYLKSLNLNLTADKVLYEYTSVISTIRRNTL
jgi:polar amino acid transport system substrate-binding protein